MAQQKLEGDENGFRPNRAVSDLTLDKLILKEAAKGNIQALRVAARAWTM